MELLTAGAKWEEEKRAIDSPKPVWCYERIDEEERHRDSRRIGVYEGAMAATLIICWLSAGGVGTGQGVSDASRQ
jgi:hypothetical protein